MCAMSASIMNQQWQAAVNNSPSLDQYASYLRLHSDKSRSWSTDHYAQSSLILNLFTLCNVIQGDHHGNWYHKRTADGVFIKEFKLIEESTEWLGAGVSSALIILHQVLWPPGKKHTQGKKDLWYTGAIWCALEMLECPCFAVHAHEHDPSPETESRAGPNNASRVLKPILHAPL